MTDQTLLHIGRRLRQLRGELSQESFAEVLDMHRSQLSRLENGVKAGPSLRTLSHIADRLGMRLTIRFVKGNNPAAEAKE
jgi:transcriptional regulator with XRE-family HTH domain